MLKHRLKRAVMFERAVGFKITKLWRTGSLPSVGHGAAVSGISNAELIIARHIAAMIAGCPKRGASSALCLATQRDPRHDPAFDATTAPVFSYLRAIWEQLNQLRPTGARLEGDRRRYLEVESGTWAYCGGHAVFIQS